MININHPNANNIFEASGYLGRIKNLCRDYIIQSFEDRKSTFETMKQECVDLRSFSEIHFKDNMEEIKNTIELLLAEIESLEKINNPSEEGNCKVCNHKLYRFDSLVKEFGFLTVCNHCTKTIYDLTNKLEWQTGVAWI